MWTLYCHNTFNIPVTRLWTCIQKTSRACEGATRRRQRQGRIRAFCLPPLAGPTSTRTAANGARAPGENTQAGVGVRQQAGQGLFFKCISPAQCLSEWQARALEPAQEGKRTPLKHKQRKTVPTFKIYKYLNTFLFLLLVMENIFSKHRPSGSKCNINVQIIFIALEFLHTSNTRESQLGKRAECKKGIYMQTLWSGKQSFTKKKIEALYWSYQRMFYHTFKFRKLSVNCPIG